MKIQEAILKAQKTTGKIRLGRWLSSCYVFVENGFVRNVHNEEQTGDPHQFNIDELMSEDWEVAEGIYCPHCREFVCLNNLSKDKDK